MNRFNPFINMAKKAANINSLVAASPAGRLFRLEGSGHEREIRNTTFSKEVWAGLTTFSTMAYIIAVNSSLMAQSGGTCVCNDTTDPTCAADVEYNNCLVDLQRDFVTATAAMCALASVVFGLVTNLPIALGPGMGPNCYFVYQIVGYHGVGGLLSYRKTLTVVFTEGLLFLFLSLVGMRHWLVKLIPPSIKVASGVGIGLFLTEVGLSYSTGVGAITPGFWTVLTIGGCPEEYLNSAGRCSGHEMTNPRLWIAFIFGGILTVFLMAYRVKSAILIGIIIVSAISWPRGSTFTYFPYTEDGQEKFDFFKKVVDFHPIKNVLVAQDWNISKETGHFALALFTLLYVDLIDCTATMYSMARFSGNVDPESSDFPRSTLAYCVDAVCISIGSLFGLSSTTAFVESGSGIAEGGRTGLTAIVTGLCFFASVFFAPIFASIPPWSTGCALILVGSLMMRQIVSINWRYIGDAIPAFVTLAFMPFSYSIAYGLIAGLLTWVVLNGMIYITKLVSGGRIVPEDADLQEYWSWKPTRGTLPWFIRIADARSFWRTSHDEPKTDFETDRYSVTSVAELDKGPSTIATLPVHD